MPFSRAPSTAKPSAESFETIKYLEKFSSFSRFVYFVRGIFSDGDFVVA